MAQILVHESHDVDDQAKSLSGWRQSYEQLACGRFHGSAWQLLMDDGMLLRESTNRRLREQIAPPPEHIVLAMTLATTPGTALAGREIGQQTLMVLSGDEEYELVAAGGLDLVGLSVRHGALARLLDAAGLAWLEGATRQCHLQLSPEAAATVRQALLSACAQAERAGWAPATPAQESALLSALLTRTLAAAMACEPRPRASCIPRRADTRQRVVQRAIAFMRTHLREDIGVPEICVAAFTCRRSLQYCFEEFMHTSPQAYLRALRLNEARRLLKGSPGQPITDIAGALGFCSSSHFTRHYRLMFDELPSETLRLACGGLQTRR